MYTKVYVGNYARDITTWPPNIASTLSMTFVEWIHYRTYLWTGFCVPHMQYFQYFRVVLFTATTYWLCKYIHSFAHSWIIRAAVQSISPALRTLLQYNFFVQNNRSNVWCPLYACWCINSVSNCFRSKSACTKRLSSNCFGILLSRWVSGKSGRTPDRQLQAAERRASACFLEPGIRWLCLDLYSRGAAFYSEVVIDQALAKTACIYGICRKKFRRENWIWWQSLISGLGSVAFNVILKLAAGKTLYSAEFYLLVTITSQWSFKLFTSYGSCQCVTLCAGSTVTENGCRFFHWNCPNRFYWPQGADA